MPSLIVAACLGGYGACWRGASTRLTRLLCSASVPQVVSGRLAPLSGHDEASGSTVHRKLDGLSSDSECNSFGQKSNGQVEQHLSSTGCAQVDGSENMLEAIRATAKTVHMNSRIGVYQHLINKFCRLGQVPQAIELLEEMYTRKMFIHANTFIPILKSLSSKFLLDEAFETVAAMGRLKIQPGIKHYNILLQACTMAGNVIENPKRFNKEKDSNTSAVLGALNSTKVQICASLFDEERLEKAYLVLEELQQQGKNPSIESFNHIIKGFCKQRRFNRAKLVLQEIEQAGLKPNSVTYSLLLDAFTASKDFHAAMKLINKMKDRGLETDKLTASVLESFRVNSGDLNNALKVVSEMKPNGQHSGLRLKSQVLSRLAVAGRLDEAYKIYEEIKVDAKSHFQGCFVTLLAACGTAGDLDRMVEIFEESICESSFSKSPEMYQPDYRTVACIHMTLSFIRHNQFRRAVQFLQHFTKLGITNDGVLVDKIFLHVASSGVDVNDGIALLKAIRALDIRPSRIALEALLDCCALEGNSEKALEIVEEMDRECLPLNIFSKIRLFGTFVAAGNQSESLRVLHDMSLDDLRDETVQFLILRIVHMHSKDGKSQGVDQSLYNEVHRHLTGSVNISEHMKRASI